MEKVLMVVMGMLVGALVYKVRHRRYVEKCMKELGVVEEILSAKTHEDLDALKDKYPHLRRTT